VLVSLYDARVEDGVKHPTCMKCSVKIMVVLGGYMLTRENGEIIGSAQLSESSLVFCNPWRSIIVTSHHNSLQMICMG
jgi:hypothetical protein